MSDSDTPAEAVDRYEGVCSTCGRPVTGEDFERVDDELASHIDDGTDCFDYRINAIYADGTERRAA